MPHGLPRKIRIAFILQAVLASLGILLGAWLVSLVIKHSLVGAALREEAAYYWTLHEASPVQPPPNTQNIRGYLLESGQSALSLPANLRNLEPGFHELPKDDQLVLVDVRPAGRLYLVFLRSRAEMLAFWFGIVPVLLTLLAVYGASWVTYRVQAPGVAGELAGTARLALGPGPPGSGRPGAEQAAGGHAGRDPAAGGRAAFAGQPGQRARGARAQLHPRCQP
jgi:hypothetical protein